MKKKFNFLTFTKRLILIILLFSIVWVSWSYILATIAVIKYGDTNTVESISTEVVRALLTIVLGYLCKAYFETKQEEHIRIMEKKFDFKSDILKQREESYQEDPVKEFECKDNLNDEV